MLTRVPPPPSKRRFECVIRFDVAAPDADSATVCASAIAFQTELEWPNMIIGPGQMGERVAIVDVRDKGPM